MTQRGQTRSGLGAASLILILLVMCLVLLGILSLMSARSDWNLSVRHAQLAQQYAEAAAAGQEALRALDEQMADAFKRCAQEAEYAEACLVIGEAGKASVAWIDAFCAEIRIDAGEDRALMIGIERCTWDKAGEKRFIVTQNVLTDMREWRQTDSLELMAM